MRAEQVAREYGQALFEAAQGKGELEKVAQEIDVVGELFADPEFEGFFQSIKISSEEKKSVFNKVFLQEVSVLTRNFFWVMFDNNRENLFNEMRNEFDMLLDEQSRRTVAKIVTAVPLDDELKAKMQNRLTETLKKEVILETTVDPSIYGGMLIYTNDQIIDASVKSRLNDLREKLIQTR
ncbi:MAG: ATP synthase F1 subunit delta [Candidatus Aquicultor sp.]